MAFLKRIVPAVRRRLRKKWRSLRGPTVPTYRVGHAGRRIGIRPEWRVLDVGSGHNPHPRAEVLLESRLEDDTDRSGAPVRNPLDPRLVMGDALAMPFPDKAFDYAIASHVAEHVADPVALCRELSRVARRGYVETPGWFGDVLLREDYHVWRVRKHRAGLLFQRVIDRRPLGAFGEWFYRVFYFGVARTGHEPVLVAHPLVRATLVRLSLGLRLLWCLPGIRGLTYTCLEWESDLPCVVKDVGAGAR